jgi:uncharacterized protein YegJ (DUF2314 family)
MRRFSIFLISALLAVLSATHAFTKDVNNDGKTNIITYKSIIYFFPESTPPSQNDLSKEMQDFTRLEIAPKSINKPYVYMEVMDNFADSYPAPDLDYLRYAGRGLSGEQANNIQMAKHILILDVAYPQSNSLQNYKTVNKFLYKIAIKHGGLIWDSETRELFAPSAWKKKRLAPYTGSYPNVANHITIHAYNNETDKGIRAITLGMAKFGLPDVVVNDFSWSLSQPIGNLINLVSQSLMEGMTPDETDALTLNVNKLQNVTIREELKRGLKDNAVAELNLSYGEAKVEEGDPDNFLLEILFDRAEGDSLSEKQDNTLSMIFGWEDSITQVNHDAEILAASMRSKAKLNGLRKDFRDGLQPGEFISLKAPFKTETGGNEWMWVEVTSWKNDVVEGILKNQPFYVPELSAGSEVVIDQNDVFDYIRNFADGTTEGNETGELMRKNK